MNSIVLCLKIILFHLFNRLQQVKHSSLSLQGDNYAHFNYITILSHKYGDFPPPISPLCKEFLTCYSFTRSTNDKFTLSKFLNAQIFKTLDSSYTCATHA